MNGTEREQRIGHLIIQWAPEPVSGVTDEDLLVEDLFYDSLALIELATSLKDEFSIALPEDDLLDVRTVGDVVGLVERAVR